jgi:HD-GYP domain-containing protein (c-di-GMP phosphodiesterase class II)
MASGVRLAELLCSLSLVGDAGYALEPGEAMRGCVVACGLAREAGLPDGEVREAFFTALLRHVGCVGFAHELATVLGDDLQANEAGARTNFARPVEVFNTLIPGVTRGRPLLERGRVAAWVAFGGRGIGSRYEATSCEVARVTARRIGLSGGVQRSLYETFEWWNGKGHPQGLRGDAIAPGARVARIATDAVLFYRLGGPELAVQAMKERAGSIADPDLVDVFVREAVQFLTPLADRDPRELVLSVEPEPHAEILPAEIPVVAEAFADLADLKSVFMLGHSREVARIAVAAGEHLELDEQAIDDLRVAGCLHDLGRIAIPNRIWEKTAPLTSVEWEQVRLHPYHSERMLRSCALLAGPAGVVAAHHERLDGSGYHRGDRGRAISTAARVLAAADVFQAMTQPRPHRDPKTPVEAAAELTEAARNGRLDRGAVEAVLAVSGQHMPRDLGVKNPAGLTEREVQVLALAATGASNAEIGQTLGISRRTAEHHLQSAYARIGASSRAAAALFAAEHDLLAPRSAQGKSRRTR